MKICWSNLEKLKLNVRGNLVDKHRSIYIEKESCAMCENSYLTKQTSRGSFCSRSCRMKFHRKNMSGMSGKKHSNEARQKMSKAKHNYVPWSKGRKFSKEHRKKLSDNHADFTLDKHPRWKGGRSFEPYCLEWTEALKRYIKERDGDRCLNPDCFNNSKRLSVHHINYNKKFCDSSNLITLCTSCNSRANVDKQWHEAWYKAIINRRYGGIYNG